MPGMSNTQLGVRHSRHPASGTGIQPGTPSQRAKMLNAMPGCQMPGCWMPVLDAECRESLRPSEEFDKASLIKKNDVFYAPKSGYPQSKK